MSQETIGTITQEEITVAGLAEPEAEKVRTGVIGKITEIANDESGALLFPQGTAIDLDLQVDEALTEDVRGLVWECIEELRR